MTEALHQKSKYLSYVLRHRPDVVGLHLDKNGWTDLETLIEKTGISKRDLEVIVASDGKGRYSFSPDGTKIRANQGHSAKGVEPTFKSAVPPTVLYHGTTMHSVDGILKQGLLPMRRTHVHLSADIEVARSVGGRRKGTVVIFEIDAKRALADGLKLYLSDNGVWLVKELPPTYLKVLDDQPI